MNFFGADSSRVNFRQVFLVGANFTRAIMNQTNFGECPNLEGHFASVLSVVCSPDGKQLATASCDKTVHIWDSESHQQITVLEGHSDRVRSAVYSPVEKQLATTSLGKTVHN